MISKGNRNMLSLSQEFVYELKNEEICIERCYAYGNVAVIPEEIDGYPVTELGAYAFSVGAVHAFGTITSDDRNGLPRLAGEKLEEIIIPKTVKRVGRYAFYNCKNLRRLEFHNGLVDLGAGAFTGCHKVREIMVHFENGKESRLREFLVELAEEQVVTLCYENGEAQILFPEYYEESIENTPARNLEVFTHGSGMMYRNCFVKKELDFQLYDERFGWAVGKESSETLFNLIFFRLLQPFQLSEKAKRRYLDYLKENLQKCAAWAAEGQREDALQFLAEYCTISAEQMDIVIRETNKYGQTVALSSLMDQKRRKYGVKRKVFDL